MSPTFQRQLQTLIQTPWTQKSFPKLIPWNNLHSFFLKNHQIFARIKFKDVRLTRCNTSLAVLFTFEVFILVFSFFYGRHADVQIRRRRRKKIRNRFLKAKAKKPLQWRLRLSISARAGRLWCTLRWATSTLIISHNVSTHWISQVVCCALHSQDAADTSPCCDIDFNTQSGRSASWIKCLSAQQKSGL